MTDSIYWLWETCRIIANEKRLQLLHLILEDPTQCVNELAAEVGLTPSATSIQLKHLCEEYLVSAHRAGSKVSYSFGSGYAPPHSLPLQTALKKSFSDGFDYPSIKRQATGCTHQRRIELIQRIAAAPSSIHELAEQSKMSFSSVTRHIQKLEVRGYVICNNKQYHTTKPSGYLASALSRIIIQASKY